MHGWFALGPTDEVRRPAPVVGGGEGGTLRVSLFAALDVPISRLSLMGGGKVRRPCAS